MIYTTPNPQNENASGEAGIRVTGLQAEVINQYVQREFTTVWDFPKGRMKRPVILDRVPEYCEEYLCKQFEQALSIVANESGHHVRAERVVDIVFSIQDMQAEEALYIHGALSVHRDEAIDYARNLRAQQRGYLNHHGLYPSPNFFKTQKAFVEARKKYVAVRKAAKLRGVGI